MHVNFNQLEKFALLLLELRLEYSILFFPWSKFSFNSTRSKFGNSIFKFTSFVIS